MKRTVETKFYTFSQNNSGGSFVHKEKDGIGHYVVVEAIDHRDANNRAETIGLYFEGYGDCECCGSRWSDVSSYDAKETPTIYDKDISNGVYLTEYGMFFDNLPSYIHYMDGTIKKVVTKQEKVKKEKPKKAKK